MRPAGVVQQREDLAGGLRVLGAGIIYDSLLDEYSFTTAAGNAGFELQGDETYLLVQDPDEVTARVRYVPTQDTYHLFSA